MSDTTTATQEEVEVVTEEVSEDEQKSKLNEVREETITELIAKRHEVKLAEAELEVAKLEQKEAKLTLEAKQEKLNRLVDQLEDINNGNYQPQFDFPNDASAEDPAKKDTLEILDITPSQVEKLEEAEIETVAQLEEAIGQGAIQKISGIGEAAVDRISDAVLKYREICPVPQPRITDAEGNEFTAEELVEDAKDKLG